MTDCWSFYSWENELSLKIQKHLEPMIFVKHAHMRRYLNHNVRID